MMWFWPFQANFWPILIELFWHFFRSIWLTTVRLACSGNVRRNSSSGRKALTRSRVWPLISELWRALELHWNTVLRTTWKNKQALIFRFMFFSRKVTQSPKSAPNLSGSTFFGTADPIWHLEIFRLFRKEAVFISKKVERRHWGQL